MTLIEALENAKNDQILSRKYTIANGMSFSKWCTAVVIEQGRFIAIKWGGKIKLEDLTATNWEIIQ